MVNDQMRHCHPALPLVGTIESNIKHLLLAGYNEIIGVSLTHFSHRFLLRRAIQAGATSLPWG